MGSSTFSRDDYAARSAYRSATSTPVFAHTADIHAGRAKASVHDNLKPFKATRECRDSDAHPISVPIAILFDTTGSMQTVPEIIQAELPKLMGAFLDDKASGKHYLGDGYPSILVGAVDDYPAMGGNGDGSLQVGQFESGIEIDQNLEKLWLTGRGGRTYEESYDLGLYFMARHTFHDHMEKRGKRGYLFIIGDEKTYPRVSRNQVSDVTGDSIQGDIPVKEIVEETQRKYNVFFIIPAMTSHWGDPALENHWRGLVGQNVLKLPEPSKICELIAATVALFESDASMTDLTSDLGLGDSAKALISLSKTANLGRYSASGLVPVGGISGGIERL